MDGDEHLSRISTMWTQIRAAHGDEHDGAALAVARRMECYAGAIHRYLRKVLGSADAADEVFQEFALRLVQGGFRNADPSRGRFRDYLKISLLRMASRYRRQKWTGDKQLESMHLADAVNEEPALDLAESQFLASCREEFLSQAWAALHRSEQERGQPWFTALKHRAKYPDATSGEMAAALGEATGADYTAAAARKILERARRKFADLLLDKVASGLNRPSRDELEQELVDLDLHVHCRASLQRRRPDGGGTGPGTRDAR